jgi:hypothetical protein
MAYEYYRYGSYVGSGEAHKTSTAIQNLTAHHLTSSKAVAFLITTIDTHVITLPSGEYRIFMIGGGGGGSSASSSSYGGAGGFFWMEGFLPGGTYEVGVGAGGKYTYTNQYNYALNSSNYPMKGGYGSYGSSNGSGSGGGGSYLRWNTNSNPNVANWDRYIFIVGGGGAVATHNYTYNAGGHGFGVAGTAWSTELPNSSSYAGKNGFNSTGAGGFRRAGSNQYNDGGGTSIANSLNGGNTYAYSSGHNGGAGGGGAGGGGGGGGGDGNRPSYLKSQDGGYISTNTTVTGYGGVQYTSEVTPRGGGGGGGHSSDCGATGGGGGLLLFTEYTNSWGSTQGTNIPYWSSSLRQNGGAYHMSDYTAYSDLISYTNSYILGSPSNFWNIQSSSSTLYKKGWPGAGGTAGGNGMVFIISKDAIFPYADITQV